MVIRLNGPVYEPWVSKQVNFNYTKLSWKKYQVRRFCDWFKKTKNKDPNSTDVQNWLNSFQQSDFNARALAPSRLQPLIDKQLRSPINSPPKKLAEIEWDTNKPDDVTTAKWRGVQISRYLINNRYYFERF